MNKNRLKILSKSEINELYGIPQFTAAEQKSYFALSAKEYEAMDSCGSPATKTHFVLQLGYFKATSRFFDCTFDEAKRDVNFILEHHLDHVKLHVKTISQRKFQKILENYMITNQ